MDINSIYATNFQIIQMTNRPLLINKDIRNAFHSIFTKKDCFSSFKPRFIRKTGAITKHIKKIANLDNPELVGTPALNDQRMENNFFELKKGLFLKAYKDKIKANGRIFIHIYPSGYVILLIAIIVRNIQVTENIELNKLIKEIHPGRKDGTWDWQSKIGTASLPNLINTITNNVLQSFFKDLPSSARLSKWYSHLKIVGDVEPEIIAKSIIRGPYVIFPLSEALEHDNMTDSLIISSEKIITHFSSTNQRKKYTRKLFWKINYIYEFLILKYSIYDDLFNFFINDTSDLKKIRLNKLPKLEVKLKADKPELRTYINELDRQTRDDYNSFERRIYYEFSKITRFDGKRNSVLSAKKSWEKEVEQWEPFYVRLWRILTKPIGILFGK